MSIAQRILASKAISMFRIPELRQRILFTIGMLIVFRIGAQIPLPGIDLESLRETAARQVGDVQKAIFGLMNAFSAGSFDQPSLFSLGVMPYISASIIFSILVKVIPSLEALSKEGAAGQKKINQYTRYLTVPICILQSLFVILGVVLNENYHLLPPGMYHFYSPMMIGFMVAMTAGTLFLMWLGEQISEYGIGNGISLLIMVGIIDRVPSAIHGLTQGKDDSWQIISVLAAIWVLTVFVIVYITRGQRRIPIQQAKQTRGRRIYGGQRHYLPLKINQTGVMPIIFASAIFVVPTIFGSIVGWEGLRDVFSKGTGFIYIVTYTALIFFFSYFWNTLMFNPDEMSNQLKESGSFIPGIRPGRKTAEYLDFVITRITLAGSAFLAVLAIVPNMVHEGFQVSYGFSAFLGGTSILIVVGVALDVVDKLNAHLLMHNYAEFGKGGGGWAKARV